MSLCLFHCDLCFGRESHGLSTKKTFTKARVFLVVLPGEPHAEGQRYLSGRTGHVDTTGHVCVGGMGERDTLYHGCAWAISPLQPTSRWNGHPCHLACFPPTHSRKIQSLFGLRETIFFACFWSVPSSAGGAWLLAPTEFAAGVCYVVGLQHCLASNSRCLELVAPGGEALETLLLEALKDHLALEEDPEAR